MIITNIISIVAFTILMISEFSNGGKRIHSFAGPYRLLGRWTPNQSAEYHSQNKMAVRMFFTSPSIKSAQYVWGESHNDITLDDSLDADVYISSWSNNQWKKNAFILKFPGACSAAMKHAKSIMPYLFGEDGKHGCPIPVGQRETRNQTFDPIFPMFPTFPYGRWLFELVLRRKKTTTVIGVVSIDGDAVPRL